MISIIMPVFNAVAFLEKSISSVVAQSYEDWELLLIDDGSTDASLELCRNYCEKDPRITAYSQANGGPGAARNLGTDGAKGEYLMFLDADDYLDVGALETLVMGFADEQVDLVLGSFSKLENTGEKLLQPAFFSVGQPAFEGERLSLDRDGIKEYVRHFLNSPSNHLISYCWARLYKTSVIRKHSLAANETMHLFEDFVFNLEYLQRSEKLVFINKSVYVYVQHATNMSASRGILNAGELIHDMHIFHRLTESYLMNYAGGSYAASEIKQEIEHALIHYTIIFIIRSCWVINASNRAEIFRNIQALLRDPLISQCLSIYRPKPGYSRLLPTLMRWRLVNILILASHQRALKRYGKATG